MKKCLGVCFILVAFLGFANAALAETPQPPVQGLSLEQLHQAVFAPVAPVANAAETSDQASLQGIAGLTPEPILMSHCIDDRPCAYHLCTCAESCACGSNPNLTKCGPTWVCACNPC